MEYTVHFGDDALEELKKAIGAYTVNPLEITANGTYTADAFAAFNPVTVNVAGGGGGQNTLELKRVKISNDSYRDMNVLAILDNTEFDVKTLRVNSSDYIYVPCANGKMSGLICLMWIANATVDDRINYHGMSWGVEPNVRDNVESYENSRTQTLCCVSLDDIPDDKELFIFAKAV